MPGETDQSHPPRRVLACIRWSSSAARRHQPDPAADDHRRTEGGEPAGAARRAPPARPAGLPVRGTAPSGRRRGLRRGADQGHGADRQATAAETTGRSARTTAAGGVPAKRAAAKTAAADEAAAKAAPGRTALAKAATPDKAAAQKRRLEPRRPEPEQPRTRQPRTGQLRPRPPSGEGAGAERTPRRSPRRKTAKAAAAGVDDPLPASDDGSPAADGQPPARPDRPNGRRPKIRRPRRAGTPHRPPAAPARTGRHRPASAGRRRRRRAAHDSRGRHPRHADLLAATTAARLVTKLVDIQSSGRIPAIALTGGGVGTKVLVYLNGSPARDAVDWCQVEIFWGDERFVPVADPDRNETAGQGGAAGPRRARPGAGACDGAVGR